MAQMWEELVSDGHVRAARYRRIRPLLVALGLLILLIGLWLVEIAPRPAVSGGGAINRAAPLMQQAREPAVKMVSAIAPFSVTTAQSITVMPLEQLKPAVDAMIAALKEKDAFPPSPAVTLRSPKDFWQSPWPAVGAVAAGDGDVRVAGILVDREPNPYVADLRRWIGVFRKTKDGWQMRSLVGDDQLVAADGYDIVSPDQVPVSLGRVKP